MHIILVESACYLSYFSGIFKCVLNGVHFVYFEIKLLHIRLNEIEYYSTHIPSFYISTAQNKDRYNSEKLLKMRQNHKGTTSSYPRATTVYRHIFQA